MAPDGQKSYNFVRWHVFWAYIWPRVIFMNLCSPQCVVGVVFSECCLSILTFQQARLACSVEKILASQRKLMLSPSCRIGRCLCRSLQLTFRIRHKIGVSSLSFGETFICEAHFSLLGSMTFIWSYLSISGFSISHAFGLPQYGAELVTKTFGEVHSTRCFEIPTLWRSPSAVCSNCCNNLRDIVGICHTIYTGQLVNSNHFQGYLSWRSQPFLWQFLWWSVDSASF